MSASKNELTPTRICLACGAVIFLKLNEIKSNLEICGKIVAAAVIALHEYVWIVQFHLFGDCTSFWFSIDSQNIECDFGMTRCWKWNFNISANSENINEHRWNAIDKWLIAAATYTLYPVFVSAIILFIDFSDAFYMLFRAAEIKLHLLTCFDFDVSFAMRFFFIGHFCTPAVDGASMDGNGWNRPWTSQMKKTFREISYWILFVISLLIKCNAVHLLLTRNQSNDAFVSIRRLSVSIGQIYL